MGLHVKDLSSTMTTYGVHRDIKNKIIYHDSKHGVVHRDSKNGVVHQDIKHRVTCVRSKFNYGSM